MQCVALDGLVRILGTIKYAGRAAVAMRIAVLAVFLLLPSAGAQPVVDQLADGRVATAELWVNLDRLSIILPPGGEETYRVVFAGEIECPLQTAPRDLKLYMSSGAATTFSSARQNYTLQKSEPNNMSWAWDQADGSAFSIKGSFRVTLTSEGPPGQLHAELLRWTTMNMFGDDGCDADGYDFPMVSDALALAMQPSPIELEEASSPGAGWTLGALALLGAVAWTRRR